MNLIEKSTGRSEGSTSAAQFNNLLLILDEFFSGVTVDQNLLNMVLDAKEEHPMHGADFWQAHGLSADHDVKKHHEQSHEIDLSLPSKGDYKLPHYNF